MPSARWSPNHEREPVVLHRVDDVADILDANGGPVPVGDDDVAVLRGVEQLIVGIERNRLMRGLDLAFRVVDGGGDERVAHVFEADPRALPAPPG